MSAGDLDGRDDGLNLPDNVIGIGNAGKSVVTHYLSQDWIVERAVGGEDSDEFSAFIIDTATDEQSDDEREVKRINNSIEQTAESLGRNPDLIDTGITYINPLDDASDQFISRVGLTSEATVGTIARNDNLTAWWLENDGDMLTNGYSEGVLRRRGLCKALYHASRATKGGRSEVSLDNLSRNLSGDRAKGRSATIVAGLGGGTGSGMYLDLAKHLNEEVSELHLVASIPGIGEEDQCGGNCFAALSELEYLALNDENPFTTIVLVPYGPARNLSDQDSFLDAFVQTIIARESTTNAFSQFLNEAGSNPVPKKFAPFTIAVPQILRYAVGDVREQEKAINEYQETKRTALDAEIELYEAIHDYFTETWDGEVSELLTEARRNNSVPNDQFALSGSEASSLRNRLDDLRSWLEDEDRFGSVTNDALVNWREQLGQWIDREEAQTSDRSQERIKKQLVTRVPERVENLRPVEDQYASEPSERKLASVIRDELRAIKLRADLLRALKVIDEEEVREAVDSAIDPDADGFIGSRRLEDRVNSLTREVDTHESNLEVLDDLEADLEDARDYVMESWHDSVDDDLELLVELDSNADEVRDQLQDLNTEFEGELRTISRASSPDEVRAGGLKFDFDRLNAQLRDIGVDPIDGQQISDSIEQTKRAHEIWDDLNNGSTILGKFGFGDRQEKENEYVAQASSVDKAGYVDITPSGERGDFEQDFSCTPTTDGLFEDVISEIEEKRQRIRHRIVQEFKTAISEFEGTDAVADRRAQWTGDGFDLEWPGDTGDAVPTLRDRLENLDAESADAVLDDLTADGTGYEDPGTVYVAFADAYLGPIEQKRSELHDAVDEKETRAQVYESLRDVVVQYDDAFDGMGPTRPEVDDAQNVGGSDVDGPYLEKISSEDQLTLLQYEDIGDSGVWSDKRKGERNKIETYFTKRFLDTAIDDTGLNCLSNRSIETKNPNNTDKYAGASNTRYDGHYVGNIYMSRAFPEQEDPGDEIFADIERAFRESIHLRDGGDGYTHESKSYGAPWDLSMVTFVGGVFLDNLHPMVQPLNGYRSSYESQREELAESVRIRHVHGVDGRDGSISAPEWGGYVYRDSMLDLDDPEDLYNLLDSNEEEVVEMLLDEYVGHTTFPSSIDLDDDA